MPTFTTKYNLQKDDPGENYDVAVVNANLDKIAQALGIIICTSVTRPSSPVEGMGIFETDSWQFRVYHGGVWKQERAGIHAGNLAGRPTVGLYEGYPYYRTDRDWLEIYDGLSWRVQGVASCTSTGDRTSSITAPYDGQLVVTTDSGSLWVYRSGSWFQAGGITVDNKQVTAGTTTSTSYTATLTGGTACGISFTAPPSGIIIVHNTCETMNNTPPELALCSFRVRTGATLGSGTDVLPVSDDEAVFSIADTRHGLSRLVSGLTPMANYNVQQLFRVTGGTGTFGRKQLIVTPG